MFSLPSVVFICTHNNVAMFSIFLSFSIVLFLVQIKKYYGKFFMCTNIKCGPRTGARGVSITLIPGIQLVSECHFENQGCGKVTRFRSLTSFPHALRYQNIPLAIATFMS